MDFDRWSASQGRKEVEPDLPEGVWEAGQGVYVARCRSCGLRYELLCAPQEFTEEGNYCGGSYRCIP